MLEVDLTKRIVGYGILAHSRLDPESRMLSGRGRASEVVDVTKSARTLYLSNQIYESGLDKIRIVRIAYTRIRGS